MRYLKKKSRQRPILPYSFSSEVAVYVFRSDDYKEAYDKPSRLLTNFTVTQDILSTSSILLHRNQFSISLFKFCLSVKEHIMTTKNQSQIKPLSSIGFPAPEIDLRKYFTTSFPESNILISNHNVLEVKYV